MAVTATVRAAEQAKTTIKQRRTAAAAISDNEMQTFGFSFAVAIVLVFFTTKFLLS